ncbi:MAG: hypothetical protein RRX92_04400 [Lachnospiraceae bacterium]
MKYAKPIMSVSELADMGFSKSDLRNYSRIEGQNFATTTTGGGKILFDTEKFEEFRRLHLSKSK